MTELHILKKADGISTARDIIAAHIKGDFKILKNNFGKPYIEGDPLYFSISHSEDILCVAVSDFLCGVDIEFLGHKCKNEHILSHFCPQERAEAAESELEFLKHWTAREAYVKAVGGSVFLTLDKVAYYNNAIFFEEKKQPFTVDFTLGIPERGVIALCRGAEARADNIKIIRGI